MKFITENLVKRVLAIVSVLVVLIGSIVVLESDPRVFTFLVLFMLNWGFILSIGYVLIKNKML